MGSSQNYVRGGGSHTNVPIPLSSKVDLYGTNKRISAGPKGTHPTLGPSSSNFDARGRKRIDWDINKVS